MIVQGDGIDSAAARAARTRRRALAKRAAAARLRPATPPPAPGRKHHPIQTEYYLEEVNMNVDCSYYGTIKDIITKRDHVHDATIEIDAEVFL